MRLRLVGDSHLDYLPPDLMARLNPGGEVALRAVGGATISQVPAQLGDADVHLLSIGTNDAFGWGGTAVGVFVETMRRIAVATAPGLVLLRPPGVWEPSLDGLGPELAESIDALADTASDVVTTAGGIVVDVRDLLAPLGAGSFDWDGVHLSRAGYEAIVPRLRGAIASLT